MPYQLLDIKAAANYLHLTPEVVEQRAKEGAIPSEKRGGRIVFRKTDIEAWASQNILGLDSAELSAFHEGAAGGDFQPQGALLPPLLSSGAFASAMTSKTKASVLRDLVALADKTGQLNDPAGLLESLEEREELCSTAVPGGFALPHPRSQQQYLFEKSFMVVGRTLQEIYFGAPDGEATTLFFLICCQGDRLHLHTLARLCVMTQKTGVLSQLRDAPDAQTMRDALIAAETEVLSRPVSHH
jgi:mannitol/fructose-specific phosphotransferase system IIA component (Ntr-type)